MRKILIIITMLVFWQLASSNGTVEYFISKPYDVLEYFISNPRPLARAFFITLFEASAGLVLGVLSAYYFGVLCVFFPKIVAPTKSVFIITQVLPIITLAPLFIAVLGIGMASKIVMVAIMCFFPVFINLLAGFENVRQYSDDLLDMYNATKLQKLRKIYLPLSLPQAMVGIKIASTMAVLGAIVAEFIGAYYGLGKNLYSAPKLSNAELMMASALLTAVMGTIIFKLVEVCEQRLVTWSSSND